MNFEVVFISVTIVLGLFAIASIAIEYSKRRPEEKELPRGIVFRERWLSAYLKKGSSFRRARISNSLDLIVTDNEIHFKAVWGVFEVVMRRFGLPSKLRISSLSSVTFHDYEVVMKYRHKGEEHTFTVRPRKPYELLAALKVNKTLHRTSR